MDSNKYVSCMLKDTTFEKIELADLWIELMACDVHVSSHDLNGHEIRLICAPRQSDRFSYDGTPLDVFRQAVNNMRKRNGKDSLEEELEKKQSKVDAHLRVPFVRLGDDSRCTCGSREPLTTKGVVTFNQSWIDGAKTVDLKSDTVFSEFGQCPDCKQSYKIS